MDESGENRPAADGHIAGDPSSARDPLLGSVLAERYRIDRVVGEGGMGVVYGAYQIGLDREVAIKLLHPDLVSSKKEVERFRREALATARLRHPNIITVHDFGMTAGGRAFLVMQFLTGRTLRQVLKEHGPYAPDQALNILKPISMALDASHRAGIVHCDVKPSNIVVPAAGDPDDVVRVVDFGIARLREQAEATGHSGGFIIGSPAYMAPELADGSPATTLSDIYSLGVVAYEVLTGRRPFSGKTYFEILRTHIEGPPPLPSSVQPGISVDIDATILRCVHSDPDERFQTAAQFAESLESAIRGTGRAERSGAGGSRLPSVLVVDDDRDLGVLIKTVLEKAGYAVTLAEDGVDALLRLGGGEYDLIVSDVEMPNLDGFTLLAMKSQKGIAAPVIFLTARTGADDETRGLELGAADYIRKPFTIPVLLARVRRLIEKPPASG